MLARVEMVRLAIRDDRGRRGGGAGERRSRHRAPPSLAPSPPTSTSPTSPSRSTRTRLGGAPARGGGGWLAEAVARIGAEDSAPATPSELRELVGRRSTSAPVFTRHRPRPRAARPGQALGADPRHRLGQPAAAGLAPARRPVASAVDLLGDVGEVK